MIQSKWVDICFLGGSEQWTGFLLLWWLAESLVQCFCCFWDHFFFGRVRYRRYQKEQVVVWLNALNAFSVSCWSLVPIFWWNSGWEVRRHISNQTQKVRSVFTKNKNKKTANICNEAKCKIRRQNKNIVTQSDRTNVFCFLAWKSN